MARGSNPLVPKSRDFTDNPNSTARLKNSMDKECCGLETGRQVSNLRLLNLRPGALSLLSYIRIRFRCLER